ncbi:MAG: nuclear transport factor 2 family protein [Kastovskya adunca ATA6-11-RM4]|jgi:hypothetical protein|nr:nuclear transport factor 2 family protein [Kastovskya adunca ATA6-11-RM4]
MRNPVTSFRQPFNLVASLLVAFSFLSPAQAASPETAPEELKNAIAQIDVAANARNLEGVMQFYSPNFTHTDGLTRDALKSSLTQLWERYPELKYRTELKSWEAKGDDIIAETVTYITGTQPDAGSGVKLESTLRSRQRFDDQKIVEQTVLAERTQLMSGKNPPTVKVNLPEQVRVGQQYSFDAIVQEPLGDALLLGTAMEEPVNSDRLMSPSKFELELLSAGGIFKVGKAPLRPDGQWISAVLIRGDGMTTITQRLNVVER